MLDNLSLGQFSGTGQYHRWSMLFPKMFLTDGAFYVAEHGGTSGAFWLFDAIASQIYLAAKRNPMCQYMQFWTLKVNKEKKSAVLTCVPDSGMDPVVTQKIEYTDFDLDEITIWVQFDGDVFVLLLPSEY